MKLNRGLFRSKFEHIAPKVSLLLHDDQSAALKTIIGNFAHKVKINDTVGYYERSIAVNNFLANIHGTMAISSYSAATPKFVTGDLNIPSMEIPAFEFSYYEIAVFVYYKIDALYGDVADITDFTFHVEVPYNVVIELDLESLDNENPYMDEVMWVAAMNNIESAEEATEEDIADLETNGAWWRRPTGELRDFFNFIDPEDTDQMDNLVAFNIDLGVDMAEVIKNEERRKHDIEVAQKIATDYREGAELPDAVLKEITNLVEDLGLEMNDVLESIADGSIFTEYSPDDSKFFERMVTMYEDKEPSTESPVETTEEDDSDDSGPTVVSL